MVKEQLIEKVKTKMREVTPFDEGVQVLSPNIETIDNYIEDQLQPSCNEILLVCPLNLTIQTQFPKNQDGTYIGFSFEGSNGRNVGRLITPADFIRLHTFKMKGWERSVSRVISIENPDYQIQFNKFQRGGDAKPVVAKNSDTLEIFTFLGNEIETATYVKKINLEDFKIHDLLIDPLVTLIAANVYGMYGHKQQEQMMKEFETKIKMLM